MNSKGMAAGKTPKRYQFDDFSQYWAIKASEPDQI